MGSLYRRVVCGEKKDTGHHHVEGCYAPTWWIKYSRTGKVFYESAETDKKFEAARLLKLREGKIAEGKLPGLDAIKATIDDLIDLYLMDYKGNGRKSIKEAERYAKLIGGYFGGMKAANITTGQIMDYRTKRQAGWDPTKENSAGKKVSDATINRELSALRRMYHLGLKHEPQLVIRVPNIELVEENNVRTEYFEHNDFLALRGRLPNHQKVIATLAYYTGMRRGEIQGLKWDQVDFQRRLLRLDPGTTKNMEGRTIGMDPEVFKVLDRWKEETLRKWPSCPWICHYKGKKMSNPYRAWRKACEDIGLTGRRLHDFRRTTVRDMNRAGVPDSVAMKITGHKTRSVYDRYNIVSHSEVIGAAEKLSAYRSRPTESLPDRDKMVTMGTSEGHAETMPALEPIEK